MKLPWLLIGILGGAFWFARTSPGLAMLASVLLILTSTTVVAHHLGHAEWVVQIPLFSKLFGRRNTPNKSDLGQQRPQNFKRTAPQSGFLLDELREFVTRENAEFAINQHVVGQRIAATEIARAMENFVRKPSPSKPLSIVIAGPPASGRTTMAQTINEVVAPGNSENSGFLSISDGMSIDFDNLVKDFGDRTCPVFVFDNFDRLGSQNQNTPTMTRLKSILRTNEKNSSSPLRRAMFVFVVEISVEATVEAYLEYNRRPNDYVRTMRQVVRNTRILPDDFLQSMDVIAVIQPLNENDRIDVVWSYFRRYALVEYGVNIMEPPAADSRLEDFFIEAQKVWKEEGVSGIQEASRFVTRSAEGALARASRNRTKDVSAKWDSARREILLDLV